MAAVSWGRRLARGRPPGIGAFMFVLHRVTGIALTIYLFVHLVTLGTVLDGPDGFDRAMALMGTPTARLFELALIAVVLFHALNGVRLTILASGAGINQRALAYGVVAITALAIVLSVPFFLS